MQLDAEVLIFDQDLTPAQAHASATPPTCRFIDRTMLILDIFAQRAKSRDGKLQVELAQLNYPLPRLDEKNTMMRRLTGGIGGRGPGETKLEINRRRARERIHLLEKKIDRFGAAARRAPRRARRRELPIISIVGYTNAGKSTLLNALTEQRRARRGQAVRHAGPHQAAAAASARARGHHHRHRGLHPRPAEDLVARSAPRSRSWPTPTCCCTSSTRPTRRATSRSRRSRDPGGPRARREAAHPGVEQGRPAPDPDEARAPRAPTAICRWSPSRRRTARRRRPLLEAIEARAVQRRRRGAAPAGDGAESCA